MREAASNQQLFVVGADKGGVGKTTIARAILDYLSVNNISRAPSTPRRREERCIAFTLRRHRSSI